MTAFYYNSNYSSGFDYNKLFDPFSRTLGGFNGLKTGPISQSLVLDSEKGELVKEPMKVGKKGVSESKAMAALKSHSEAERRRRERINSHLDTLRGLVPCTEKMDKAALLAEVISEVKELKKTAIEASKGFLIPMDADEVTVEAYDDRSGNGTLFLKASLCCDYGPELLTDLRQSLDALELKMVTAEISTLGGRVKSTFIVTSNNERCIVDSEACQLLASSVQQALRSVLDKASASASPEYSPRTTLPNKRRRVSFNDSSSSSS
ncbi:HLH domain-containing protein [Cephalotus follicularis]|uniref:HLH domain-containing protein n=1 Tax=Cephalotus follicularis TaxID=3775 RepID=A0A1Q3AP39_CEPFO|nr:HLH domain-containing protein [Cephalotus follicularis]